MIYVIYCPVYTVCILISIIFSDLQIIILKFLYFQVFYDQEDPEYKGFNNNYVTYKGHRGGKFCGIKVSYQNHASNAVNKVSEPRTVF